MPKDLFWKPNFWTNLLILLEWRNNFQYTISEKEENKDIKALEIMEKQ